jgi:UDP-glucose 4-epimerase
LETELNIMPTLRFLDLMQEYDDIHLVFLSSGGTVYGNPTTTPVKESCPLTPISYHGAGKVEIEAFLQSYSSRLARPVTILRPSNLYGPGQPYRQGFGLIRTMLEHLRRDIPIEIWGDGEVVRDYIYIEDFMKVCRGFITRQDTINTADIFNVGSGKGYSINELCNIIASVTGKEIQRIYCPSRTIDVRAVILDCSKLGSRLGWQPDTDIMCGMSLTWQWLQGQQL